MGAARASTPSVIKSAPATRFLKTPERCGIGHPFAGGSIQESEAPIADIGLVAIPQRTGLLPHYVLIAN